MSKIAQAYITAFEQGKDYQRPAIGLVLHGQADGEALQLFGQALRTSDTAVREKIVALLVDVGHQLDPLTAAGAVAIRDHQVLNLLAGPALERADAAREAAMDALRRFTPVRDLAQFGDRFATLLKANPTGEMFLLIAKAKALKAKPELGRMAKAGLASSHSALIALAALGDAAIESRFISEALAASAANDARALETAIGTLGLIGTKRSMQVVGEFLRSPLTILIPGAMEKSIRISVLDALVYNFPDQPLFYPNNINDENGYVLAEQLCTSGLGAVYQQPRPPYLKYRPFPIPHRP